MTFTASDKKDLGGYLNSLVTARADQEAAKQGISREMQYNLYYRLRTKLLHNLATTNGLTDEQVQDILKGRWKDTPNEMDAFKAVAKELGVEDSNLEALLKKAKGTKRYPDREDSITPHPNYVALRKISSEDIRRINTYLEHLLYSNDAYYLHDVREELAPTRAIDEYPPDEELYKKNKKPIALRAAEKKVEKQKPVKKDDDPYEEKRAKIISGEAKKMKAIPIPVNDLGRVIEQSVVHFRRLWKEYYPDQPEPQQRSLSIDATLEINVPTAPYSVMIEALCMSLGIPFDIETLRQAAIDHEKSANTRAKSPKWQTFVLEQAGLHLNDTPPPLPPRPHK